MKTLGVWRGLKNISGDFHFKISCFRYFTHSDSWENRRSLESRPPELRGCLLLRKANQSSRFSRWFPPQRRSFPTLVAKSQRYEYCRAKVRASDQLSRLSWKTYWFLETFLIDFSWHKKTFPIFSWFWLLVLSKGVGYRKAQIIRWFPKLVDFWNALGKL